MARFLRRVSYPLFLTRGRLRARRAQALLAVTGIAAAAASLAVLTAASLVAQDRSVQRRVAEIPAAQRTIIATWGGTSLAPSDRWRSLDRQTAAALAEITATRPERVLLFPEKGGGGTAFNLGALDGLSDWIRVTDGRLPNRCAPASCEVVQIGGGEFAPGVPGIRVVGRATLRPGSPLAPFLSRRAGTFLLADGVDGLSRLAALDADFRTYGWVVPLASPALHIWSIRALLAGAARADSVLRSRSALFSVSVPTQELVAARASARIAGRRLLLMGGGIVALLLAFVALTAARSRRSAGAAVRRLTAFGARPSQVALVGGSEAIALAVSGTVVGWALGVAGAAAIALAAGTPVDAVLARSVLSSTGWWLAFGLAGAAAVLLAVVLRGRGRAPERVSPLDVAAVAALVVVAVAVARGDADPSDIGGGTGVLLLLLPGLVTFGIAVLVARGFAPALRLGERATRRASPPVRLAVVSLARDPAAASIAVVFLAVAVAVALFSASYRATLSQNVRERADFAVPADYVLREPTGRPLPLAAARRLGRTVPVIRTSGNAVSLAGRRPFTLLGIPAAEIARLRGWRSDFATESRANLADRIRPSVPPRLRGLRLPADTHVIELPIEVRGDPIVLSASILAPTGSFSTVDLGEADSGRTVLRAELPSAARGGRLVSLRVWQPVLEAFSAGHHDVGSEGAESVSKGTLVLGRFYAGGRALPPLHGWTGVRGVRASGGRFRYLVSRAQVSQIRPHQPAEDVPVPVLASPSLTATADGRTLALSIEDELVPARVVGTVERFPSSSGDVVVADERRLDVALNTAHPGLGQASELWLHAPNAAIAALRRPPFAGLTVRSHTALEHELRSDPLARGALAVLWATAGVALALAAAGVALGAITGARDARAELFDLEAQGLAPSAVRRTLDVQAGVAAAAGTLGGILAGLVLAALVVDVVAVTANASAPVPPLRLHTPWLEAATIVAAAVVAGIACSALVSRRAVTGPVPARPGEAL